MTELTDEVLDSYQHIAKKGVANESTFVTVVPKHLFAFVAAAKRCRELEKRYVQQVADECDNDTAIRELCRPYTDVDGDKYGVPGIVDVVEALVKRCRELEREVAELNEDIDRGYYNQPE